ncbi:MAG: polyhydroxyalkanoic acid system family protein [Xanthobacteraceae bacterium]
MNKPIVATVPHHLGQAEAIRRMREGLGRVKEKYSAFISIEEETWVDNQLTLRIRALGQAASAKIDVLDDHARLEVTLPWLLARVAERFIPTIQREGTLLLEKK